MHIVIYMHLFLRGFWNETGDWIFFVLRGRWNAFDVDYFQHDYWVFVDLFVYVVGVFFVLLLEVW